jgi:Subtilase family
MKYSRLFTHSILSTPARFIFAISAPFLLALAIASPTLAQRGDVAANKTASADADAPPSQAKAVSVMVEMNAAPAAVSYSQYYKAALAQADAARQYALMHPNLKSSKAALSQKPGQVQISSANANRVQAEVARLDQAQRNILPNLTGNAVGGKILFRAQRAYNGIAVLVSPDKVAAIATLPGVKAVHPMHPKFRTATFSDIDFLGTRTIWTKPAFGFHGENIKVADIDSGLDYIHANFGGPGQSGYALVPNHTVAPNALFPSQKVPGGFDFAGDAYAATNAGNAASDTPHPDPDPFDCGGHGTGTASLIGGYGVTNAGFTYSGSYDATNPVMSNLVLPPGLAPSAKLYPLRVFGCGGSTNLVTEAIEWAMDPNGDGNFSDHMDVINMSLGSDEGFADDADDVAASNAASIGVQVCSAAGNAGDTYYVHSSPAAASGTLSCAASFSDQAGWIFDSQVTVNAPGGFVGQQDDTIYTTTSPHTSATGDLVYAIPHDGSTPLTNAAQMVGKIALVDRVPGQGANASVNCQNAGAIGIIDKADLNSPTGDPFLLSTSPALTKPMVVCSKGFGDTLESEAGFDANGVSTAGLNVTIAPHVSAVHTHATNPPGTAAGAGSADTVPSYTSRGPRLPDSALKPDLTAPAEVTAVALNNSGNGFENFNGTSSATPHISGMMALLRQFHPTWTVQELNALACGTATHDLATTVGGPTKIGVGRIGSGRIDLTNAGNANVVAYNGTDPNLIGVSFGNVEVPVDGTRVLTKAIKVTNKGGSDVTYNITYSANTVASGAAYTFSAPSITVLAGTSNTFNVTLTVTGSALRHERDLSTSTTVPTQISGTTPRQYLTEHAGYAVLTPTSGSEPTQRVALYAAPKPSSDMHVTTTGVTPTADTGSFTLNLSGAGINQAGVSTFPTDIVSYVKAFELQYQSDLVGSPSAPTDQNVLKYVGIASDWNSRSVSQRNNGLTYVNFAMEGFGNAGTPDFASSDKEIFIDLDFDSVYDIVVFLTRGSNGASPTNAYMSDLVDLGGFFGPPGGSYLWGPTNGRVPDASGGAFATLTSRDTNSFNNSVITVPLNGLVLTGFTSFNYQIITFDRTGAEVDETPVLFYDAGAPGLDTDGPLGASGLEPFFLDDLASTSVPVNYNGTNFQNNASIGTMVVHMHNGTGSKVDVVAFRAPTITGFSPSHAKVGAFVTVTGSNFGPGTRVFFIDSGLAAHEATPVNVLTANSLSVKVPVGTAPGGAAIRVQNAAGSSAKGGFTVDP